MYSTHSKLLGLIRGSMSKRAAVEFVSGGSRPKYRDLGGDARGSVIGGSSAQPRQSSYMRAFGGRPDVWLANQALDHRKAMRDGTWIKPDYASRMTSAQVPAAAPHSQSPVSTEVDQLVRQYPQLAKLRTYLERNPAELASFKKEIGWTPPQQATQARPLQTRSVPDRTAVHAVTGRQAAVPQPQPVRAQPSAPYAQPVQASSGLTPYQRYQRGQLTYRDFMRQTTKIDMKAPAAPAPQYPQPKPPTTPAQLPNSQPATQVAKPPAVPSAAGMTPSTPSTQAQPSSAPPAAVNDRAGSTKPPAVCPTCGRKTAESALPAAPKVQNPAPKPLKTPSFTTQPPSISKAVADVRPGLSTSVTPKIQSLGTAKSQNAMQTAVTKPIMAPKEFRAAAPAAPLRKLAQLLNPAYGTTSKTTGQPVYGHSKVETAYANPSSWSASAQAQADELAKQRAAAAAAKEPPPTPENPHYEARSAVQAQRLEEERNAAVQRYAETDPTVVRRKTDEQIAKETAGYTGVGDRVSGAIRNSTTARNLYRALRGELRDESRTLRAARAIPDYLHDSANTMEIMANGLQKGLDWTLSKGIKWVDPRSWGSSVSARKNRLSHDNDWDNASRTYDARHAKLVGAMRMGDANDPNVQRLYAAPKVLGEFAGSSIATAGAGTALKGVGAGVTAGGRVLGAGAGRAIAAGAQRVGVSAQNAERIKNFATGLGTDIGHAAAAPARYVGNVLSGTAQAPARTVGTVVSAVRHPVQAARSVAGGVRSAANAVGTAIRHPGQAIRAGWRRGLVGKGFDAGIRADNAYRVGHGVLTGDYGDAAASSAAMGWYDAMRRINPFWGTIGGIAVPVAAHMALGSGEPPVE